MILGFGSTEKETTIRIILECVEAASSDKLNVDTAIKKIQHKYAEVGDRYKALTSDDAPERYCYFFANVNERYVGRFTIEFSFHHINRRHPFSPDGWSMIETKWMVSVHHEDCTIYREISQEKSK